MRWLPLRLAGLSSEAVVRCAHDDQRRIGIVAALYLVGPLVCGMSGVAFGRIVAGSVGAGLGLGCVAFLFNWNLLRLLVSGSGVAPHLTDDEAEHWAPSLHQTFVLMAWALLQIPVLSAFILLKSGLLDVHLAEWRILQAQLSPETSLAEPGLLAVLTIAGYRLSTWAMLTTGLAVLAVSGPLCRTWNSSAYAAYGRELRKLQRRRIHTAHANQMHALSRLIGRYHVAGRFVAAPPWYADPPFDREPIPPHPAAFREVRDVSDLRYPVA